LKPTTRYIGSLLLVALMLASNIGIGIYKHTCLVTGQEGFSLFTILGADNSNTHACCVTSQEASVQPKTKGCCQETASYHQLDIPQRSEDHYTYLQPLLPVAGEVQLPNIDLAFAELSVILPQYNNLPPPSNQRRAAQLQVYIL
jgi:hypothetical protein